MTRPIAGFTFRLALAMVLLVLLMLGLANRCFGQGGRYDNFAWSTAGSVAAGAYVVTAPNATVAVCGYPANATPCTNYATTFTSPALTSSCGNATQVVLPGSSTCQASTDPQGNLGFWAAPGTYAYTLTVGQTAYGPFIATVAPPSGPSLNGMRFADQFPGADLGAKIAAADTALGATVGSIVVTVSGAVSSAVTISANHDVVCAGDQITLTFSNTTAALIQSSNTRIKNCTIASAQATLVAGMIRATGVSNVEVENVAFIGGGSHINYNTVSKFRIANTRHVSLTAPSNIIVVQYSDHGSVVSPRVEGFTYAAGSSFRGIYIVESSYVDVVDPIAQNVDASTLSNFAGVAFTLATHSNLTGGVISGLINGDGVVVEGGSTDINITGTVSTGNGNSAGSGANHNTGDGFDIYNSARVHLSNCDARNNGNYSGGRHIGIEVYTSADVTVTGCDASDSGDKGVVVVGSPRTKLLGATASRNYRQGLHGTASTGTVNTNGTAVTLATGVGFGLAWPVNTHIIINGVGYGIASVTDGSNLVLTATAGVQAGVGYAVQSEELQVIGGSYNDNGVGLSGVAGERIGMYFDQSTTGAVIAVQSTDTRVSGKTQTYASQTANTARLRYAFPVFDGNLSGGFNDVVNNSPLIYDDGVSGATYFDKVNFTGTVPAKRYKASNGTALVAGDFGLSAAWGSTAAVSAVTGTDQAWQITVTANGVGIAGTPVATLTFKDGTWTNAPICVATIGTGTTAAAQVLLSATNATQFAITYNGTPGAGQTVIINGLCMGRP